MDIFWTIAKAEATHLVSAILLPFSDILPFAEFQTSLLLLVSLWSVDPS